MKKLTEIMANPSGFDSMANYSGEIPESNWLVVMTRNRDSDILTESNWICGLKKLGGESENVQIFRFGHWACGWWEALCVQEKTEFEEIGQEIKDDLESDLILNEDHFSEMEIEEADRIWKECYRWKERIEWIRENRSQFEFHGFGDLLAQVKGKYFRGYASELVR